MLFDLWQRRATGWKTVVQFPAVQDFSLLHSVQTDSGIHSTWGDFLGGKSAGREADQSSPSSEEVKNGGVRPQLPHMSSLHSAYLIRHRVNFTYFICVVGFPWSTLMFVISRPCKVCRQMSDVYSVIAESICFLKALMRGRKIMPQVFVIVFEIYFFWNNNEGEGCNLHWFKCSPLQRCNISNGCMGTVS
jgi:hypothetical protein